MTGRVEIINKDMQSQKRKVFKICLTGGACSGKTTSLFTISEELQVRGYKVLIIPEAATMLMKGGVSINSELFTEEQGTAFQVGLLKMQINLEDNFQEIASKLYQQQDVVIICDRGLMDGYAYVSKEAWHKVISSIGLSKEELCEKRYDGVIHLVTAAQGAEEFYNLVNEARYEEPKEALRKDLMLRKAYVTHPKHYIIYNMISKGFDEKISSCVDAVYSILGLESYTIFFKKFLLKKCENKELIEQVYGIPIDVSSLEGFKTMEVYEDFISYKVMDGEVLHSSIVKKVSKNSSSYALHLTVNLQGQIQHKKRGIQVGDYNAYLALKDPNMAQLKKKRIFLMQEFASYKVDYYPETEGQPVILQTWINQSNNTDDRKVVVDKEMRKLFDIAQDITDNSVFFGVNLAKVDRSQPSAMERGFGGEKQST